MSQTATTHNATTPEAAKADIDRLVQRLNTGWQRIEDAMLAGKDVAQWERFWIDLLTEYERACDTYRAAGLLP